MQGISISFRINSHGQNTQFFACTDNPQGYFASVCYQNFFKQIVILLNKSQKAEKTASQATLSLFKYIKLLPAVNDL